MEEDQELNKRYSPVVVDNIELFQELTPSQSINYIYYVLTQLLGRRTAVFVSYSEYIVKLLNLIANYETLEPYSIAMADEVLGEPFHMESVESKYRDSGLMDVFGKRGVPFFRILSRAPSLEGASRAYSARVADVLESSEHAHAFLSVFDDGSLGGIKSFDKKDDEQLLARHHTDYAVGYKGKDGKEHITISLGALSKMNTLWLFAFGDVASSQIRALLKGKTTDRNIPLMHLKGMHGTVKIFTDQKLM